RISKFSHNVEILHLLNTLCCVLESFTHLVQKRHGVSAGAIGTLSKNSDRKSKHRCHFSQKPKVLIEHFHITGFKRDKLRILSSANNYEGVLRRSHNLRTNFISSVWTNVFTQR